MRAILPFLAVACAPAPATIGRAETEQTDTAVDSTTPTTSSPATTTTESRCTLEPDWLACPHQTTTLLTGATGSIPRDVLWQVPLGDPPADGWPVALVFQGSFFPATLNWSAEPDGALGMWHQAMLTKLLLDDGYAVLTPMAKLNGASFWDTNIPPYNFLWQTSQDHYFTMDIFGGITDGTFGPLDNTRMYATGISSGGYMTSRMAVSYPGVFSGLAIMAGSYATCSGFMCVIPPLPADHPPTLFLHGDADPVVPISTSIRYKDALQGQGTESFMIVEPGAGHEWIEPAPESIVEWFGLH